VVHDELRPAVEELLERPGALLGVERVGLLDPHPRQIATLLGELAELLGKLVLALPQLLRSSEQLVTCAGSVLCHTSTVLNSLGAGSGGGAHRSRSGRRPEAGPIPASPRAAPRRSG